MKILRILTLVVFMHCLCVYAQEPDSPRLTISSDKEVYKVGERVRVTVLVEGIPARSWTGAGVSIAPEIRSENGEPVARIGTGRSDNGYDGTVPVSRAVFPLVKNERGDTVTVIPLGRSKREVAAWGRETLPIVDDTGSRTLNVFWDTGDKIWYRPGSDDVIYNGPGLLAGITPEGRYIYLLKELPGSYDIVLERKYVGEGPEGDELKIIRSNSIRVEILPVD